MRKIDWSHHTRLLWWEKRVACAPSLNQQPDGFERDHSNEMSSATACFAHQPRGDRQLERAPPGRLKSIPRVPGPIAARENEPADAVTSSKTDASTRALPHPEAVALPFTPSHVTRIWLTPLTT